MSVVGYKAAQNMLKRAYPHNAEVDVTKSVDVHEANVQE
jgi:hypothetical protein